MINEFCRWGIPLTIASIILTSLPGCGYKDQPIPPQQVIPLPITDLRYQLGESGVTLSWSYPVETVTGRDIVDITNFKIYRAVISPQDYCPTCPVPFAAPVIIPGNAVSGEVPKTSTYKAILLRPGNMYLFKVRSVAGWWAESKDSNIVSFYWQVPPMAATGLTASPGDSSITLNWQPATTKFDNTPVSGIIRYQVYRGIGGGQFQPLAEPVAKTSFVDNDVVNDRKYFYQIQTLAVYQKGVVGGGRTDSVSVSPLDLTPPPIPVGIRVISTDAGVRIFWEPVKSDDLAAYLIHRRFENEDTPEMIGRVKVPFLMYMDMEVPGKSIKVFYSVSSVDDSIAGNESRRSTEIEVRR